MINTSLTNYLVAIDLTVDNFSLTANNNAVVDYSGAVAQNTPTGYKFLCLEYAGAWPKTTWANAIVSLGRINNELKQISVVSLSTQAYAIRTTAYYIRNI